MRVHVLRNPAGGNRSSRRSAAHAVGRIRGAGHEVVELTGDSREASDAALAQALELGQVELLVVAGGDGLVHLAIQHLASTDVPMMIAPTGTGNDFATALGITSDTRPIEQRLTDTPLPVDLIKVSEQTTADGERSWRSDHVGEYGSRRKSEQATAIGERSSRSDQVGSRGSRRKSEKYIASIAIAGFPAAINARANSMALRLGSQIYTLAAALELASFARLKLDLVVDGEPLVSDSAMLAIGNTSLFGGGMLACPDASATDGQLDLTSIDGVGRIGILRHLKGRAGGTADRVEVIRRRAQRIEISTPAVELWGDGEPIALSPLLLEVRPAAIKIVGICPK